MYFLVLIDSAHFYANVLFVCSFFVEKQASTIVFGCSN